MSNEQQPGDAKARAIAKKDTMRYRVVTKKKDDAAPKNSNTYLLLNDQDATFRSAFDYSGIGMALMSPEGKILEANNAICNFTGYFKNELLELNFLDLGHPDDNYTDVILLNKMLTKVLNYYTHEKRYVAKNRKILWGIHTVSKALDQDGKLKYYVLQIVDITKRKEQAAELNKKNGELEMTQLRLAAKIKQLEELHNIIAHNLRGPANNMRMLVDMLKDKPGEKADNGLELEMSEIIKYLDDGSNSLLSSLNTLNDVVQISMKKDIPFENCDVQKIIDNILGQMGTVVYEKSVQVTTDLSIAVIKYPHVFLESIFYNLISNALKYTSKDRRPEITIRTYSIMDRITIAVKDNGLGIDLDKYGHKIFKLNQVFHTGHDSRGVGLYITKTQVESFGGNIQVNSTVNVGTEFIVTL